MGIWRLSIQGIGRKPLSKQWESVGCRKVVKSNFIIIFLFDFFKGFLVLIELVGKLRFLNECGYFDTVKTGDWEEASAGAEVVASVAGMVSILSLLDILFVFAGENGLVCYFLPDGGIWASRTMVEAAAAAVIVGEGVAPAKTVASGVDSLLRETVLLITSLRALSFMPLVFVLAFPFFASVNVFIFIEASTSNVSFSKQKPSNPVVGGISNEPVLYIFLEISLNCASDAWKNQV